MKTLTFKPFIFFILLLLFCVPFEASAFRCDNEWVKIGDTSQEVTAKCGQPYTIVRRTTHYITYDKYDYNPVYNCGEHDFTYEITMLNNKVKNIHILTKGIGQSQCHKPHK